MITQEVMSRLEGTIGEPVTVVYLYQGDKDPCRWQGVLRGVVPFDRVEIQIVGTPDPISFFALRGAIQSILATDGSVLYGNPAIVNGYVFPETEDRLREQLQEAFGEAAAKKVFLERARARAEEESER